MVLIQGGAKRRNKPSGCIVSTIGGAVAGAAGLNPFTTVAGAAIGLSLCLSTNYIHPA
nr:hypothetical protein [Lacticaseibacillus paracasei]